MAAKCTAPEVDAKPFVLILEVFTQVADPAVERSADRVAQAVRFSGLQSDLEVAAEAMAAV